MNDPEGSVQPIVILMITPTYLPAIGGIEYHIDSLKKYLPKRDVLVDIVVVNSRIQRFEKHVDAGGTVYLVPARKIGPFELFGKLDDYFDVSKYDVIHAHDPHIAGISLNLLLNKKYGNKLVLSTHGGFFHTKNNYLLKRIYWEIAARYLIRAYDAVICVSKSDETTFRKILPMRRLYLIENGIDFNKFNRISKSIVPSANSFIYFGRFSSNKRVDLLLDVIIELIENGSTEIKLTLVGDAEDVEFLRIIKDRASKYPENITIKDFQDDDGLIMEISKATFFITATQYEGFGMSTIEAMSAGRIPIVNNISPLNELVSNKVNGYLINFDSGAAVKEIYEVICSESNERNNVRRSALDRAKEFSWDEKVKSFQSLYLNLVKLK